MASIITATTTSGLTQSADNSGVLQLASGTGNLVTVPSGTGTAVVNGVNSSIVSGTAVASTSGTSIDFTSIPSWVKRITVMLDAVSTNGSSGLQIQLGDSGGVETSGYVGSVVTLSGGMANFGFSSGFLISSGGGETASTVRYGSLIISKVNNNTYSAIGNFSYGSSDTRFFVLAGNKDTSATLDRVRLTTVNGTDTFDAGTINILYE